MHASDFRRNSSRWSQRGARVRRIPPFQRWSSWRSANESSEFVNYLNYCRSLRFEDRPDYAYLRRSLKDLFFREGFQFDYVFDWTVLNYQAHMQHGALTGSTGALGGAPGMMPSTSPPGYAQQPGGMTNVQVAGGVMPAVQAVGAGQMGFVNAETAAGGTGNPGTSGVQLPPGIPGPGMNRLF